MVRGGALSVGRYVCVVRDTMGGELTSESAVVELRQEAPEPEEPEPEVPEPEPQLQLPLRIVQHPEGGVIDAHASGDVFTMRVRASGGGAGAPLAFHWRRRGPREQWPADMHAVGHTARDGEALFGLRGVSARGDEDGMGSTLRFRASGPNPFRVQAQQLAAEYCCVVSGARDADAALRSDTAMLRAPAAPPPPPVARTEALSIVQHPEGGTIGEGQQFEMRVRARGDGAPFAFSWRRRGPGEQWPADMHLAPAATPSSPLFGIAGVSARDDDDGRGSRLHFRGSHGAQQLAAEYCCVVGGGHGGAALRSDDALLRVEERRVSSPLRLLFVFRTRISTCHPCRGGTGPHVSYQDQHMSSLSRRDGPLVSYQDQHIFRCPLPQAAAAADVPVGERGRGHTPRGGAAALAVVGGEPGC